MPSLTAKVLYEEGKHSDSIPQHNINVYFSEGNLQRKIFEEKVGTFFHHTCLT